MKNKKLKISVFIIFLAIWQISSMIVNSEVIIPSISATIKQIVVVISEDDFYLTILNSLLRSITGFLTAVMLGVFSGVLSFCNKFLKEIFTFITKICASVPTVAIILLLLIWLRPNFVSMLIGCIMVFPMIYQSVFCSMYDYDKNIIKMLDVYNIDFKKRIKKIYIPKILIDLKKIIPTSFSINFKMVIAGEVISQPKYAIGSKLYLEKIYINTAGVFSWIVIILFLSFLIDKILNYILSVKKY